MIIYALSHLYITQIFSERYYPHFIDKEFMRLRDRAGTVAKPTDIGNKIPEEYVSKTSTFSALPT